MAKGGYSVSYWVDLSIPADEICIFAALVVSCPGDVPFFVSQGDVCGRSH